MDKVIRRFSNDGADLYIEVEGTTEGGSQYDQDLVSTLAALSKAISAGLQSDEGGPSEASVSVSVKALETGGYAIALGEGLANFKISFSWSNPMSSVPLDIPGL